MDSLCNNTKSVYDTQQQLLEKLAVSSDPLLSLLIGNIIASAVNKHSTPLRIAYGVYSCRKKTMMHMMIDQFYFVIFWQSV